ncbi:DUF6483 family protein [Anaerosporobacter faecicola]|uniref:DUF6483 family protein n=1 Tax=Anaerosporobacter faecicola TaxID=2718714 RepID=UPI001438A4A7|nr:DUF6483 family protein [Anaerosporobacter faecicola]
MFEKDYIMRIIHEMVRAVLKLVFRIDTDSPTTVLVEDTEKREVLENLLALSDDGQINDAENKLFELLEEQSRDHTMAALLFYEHLNAMSDEFLEAHDFTRTEVQEGLKAALRHCKINFFQ